MNAKRSCIASNLNRKSFVKTTYCKHGVVVICQSDSRIAQSTSQYYFVLQSLHKLLPSTTLYYKACTKHFPVLLCYLQRLHKLLPSTYFVLQSLHKLLPSTTLYYKACTNYFPVLLCTTKLAQSTSQCYFVLESLHKILPSTARVLNGEAFTHRSFYTQQAFTQRSFYTQQAFTHRTLTHSAFTHGKPLHTQQAL